MKTRQGNLTERFERTLSRILSEGPPFFTEEFVLADAIPRPGRIFTEFSGDISGRYIEALAHVAACTGREPVQLSPVVNQILRLQKTDGHWGGPFSESGVENLDMALLWGNGRMLTGLLAVYQYQPSSEILAAARRLGDWLVGVAPRLNTDEVQQAFSDHRLFVGYICWTSILEGVVELARVTGDHGCLALAREIARRTVRYPAQHSHGFVTTLRGILGLYSLEEDRRYLDQVENEWQMLMDSENVLPTGCLPEAFHPKIHRDEGCSEADWLRLNLALWDLTGKARYLDEAERVLFNAFSFNQFRTGDFGHHHLTANGVVPPAARAWWCCTLHGLRAFPDVFNAVFRRLDTGVAYDLAADGRFAADGFSITAVSRLERDGIAELLVEQAPEGVRTLSVRMPCWAGTVTLSLGDLPVKAESRDSYLIVNRVWRSGESLHVSYDMRTRTIPWKYQPSSAAIYHGPWLLGIDDQRTPEFFSEPSEQNRIFFDTLAPCKQSPSTAPFEVPAAHLAVRYVHDSYPMQPQDIVLRPVAEQTACGDSTRWQYLFADSGKS